MLKKYLFISLLMVSSSVATTLDEMVNQAWDNNKNLHSLQNAIDIANEQIAIANNWNKPVMSIGRNDIRFDEPNKRTLEPMQADFIGFSQVIPIGNKLDIKQNIALKDHEIAKYSLEDKRLQVKAKVYEYAYSIKVLEKKYELLNKYQSNIKGIEELSNALYKNGKMRQSDVINVKVSHAKIKLQKQNLQNLINNLYLKLEEITFNPIKSIEVALMPQAINLNHTINKHPKILMTQLQSERFNEVSKYEIANKTSDVKVNVAYFSRDSKYEDYANISLSIPLSVYGTENGKAAQAKIKAQQISNQLENIQQLFHTQIKTMQNNMDNALNKYTILQQTILPLKQQVQQSIESYNSLNQITPQESIINLNEVISYEMMLLDEIQQYFIAYAKSIYFTQGQP